MAIRWRHGFLRTWIIIAIFWICGNAVIAFRDDGIPSLTRGCDELRGFVDDRTGQPLGDTDVARCEAVWRTNRLTLLEWTLGPPIFLFVVGVLFGWVMRGFNPKQSN
jgi:hypothetical protein